MAKTVNVNSVFSTILSELNTFKGELGSLKGKYESGISIIEGVTIDFGSWEDDAAAKFVNYLTGTLVPGINSIDADIGGGGFNSLQTTTDGLIASISKCNTLQQEVKVTKKEMQTTPKTIRVKTGTKKVANNPDWRPSYQGGTNTDYGFHEEDVYETQTNPAYTELEEALTQFQADLEAEVAVANGLFATLAGIVFQGSAGSGGTGGGASPEETPVPDDAPVEEAPAEEVPETPPYQITDNGVIVNGVQYDTISIGLNLKDNNIDAGDYVVYDGQVYTFGKRDGSKNVILYTLDGEAVTVGAADLASKGKYVNDFNEKRGVEVSQPEEISGVMQAPQLLYGPPPETPTVESLPDQEIVTPGGEQVSSPEEISGVMQAPQLLYGPPPETPTVESPPDQEIVTPGGEQVSSPEGTQVIPQPTSSIPEGAQQFGKDIGGNNQNFYASTQTIGDGNTSMTVDVYYDADTGNRVYIDNDTGSVAICYQHEDGSIRTMFTTTSNGNLFANKNDGQKGAETIFEVMRGCQEAAAESSVGATQEMIDSQLTVHVADDRAKFNLQFEPGESYDDVDGDLAKLHGNWGKEI